MSSHDEMSPEEFHKMVYEMTMAENKRRESEKRDEDPVLKMFMGMLYGIYQVELDNIKRRGKTP